MQTFRYDHFPLDVSCVHVGLFTNVTNAAQLRARLIQASLIQGEAGDVEREAVNFAFVEARLVSPRSLARFRLSLSQSHQDI